jgi:glycosyltransferase involved in cell wall biosynthesis
MRVLIVTGIYPPDVGGPATHAADLLRALRERGHDVSVVTLGDAPRLEVRDGVTRFPRGWSVPLRMWRVAAWIAGAARDLDAVYATGMHAEAVAGARMAGKPVAVKIVGDPVWERATRLGLTSAEFESFLRAPGRRWDPRLALMTAMRNRTLRSATALTTPSAYLARVVETWLDGPAAVTVIPNGVRVPAAVMARGRDGSAGLRLAYVGRLVPHKRVERLIEAVARTEGWTLEIVGSGPERVALEELAASLAPGRVTFAGDLGHDEVLARVAWADALGLASDYEGLPHVVIEALAVGTPVISPPVGGVPEVVADGEAGSIVPEASVDALAAALARLRDDPDLLVRLRAGALAAGVGLRFDVTADGVLSLLGRMSVPRPRLVLIGRSKIPSGSDPAFREKLGRILPHADLVLVGTGRMGVRGIGRGRAVVFPAGSWSGVLFYPIAPVVALALAAGRSRAAVMCQSPYEAAGVEALARLVPAPWRPRVIVEVHGDWRTATRHYGSRLRRVAAPIADRVAEAALRHADRVRVVGAFTERLVREAGYGGEVDRFVAFRDFRDVLGRPPTPAPSDPVVAYVGGFERAKGLDVLLDAWPAVLERVPSARLEVAGPGRPSAEVRQRLRAERASVREHGVLPADGVATLLDAATCLVMPSRSEGLGRAALEAHGRGRPVVASAAGGLPEVVQDGETGRLVPTGDPDALAAAIVEVLTDPAAAAAMGAEGRVRVERRAPSEEFGRGMERLAAWVAG